MWTDSIIKDMFSFSIQFQKAPCAYTTCQALRIQGRTAWRHWRLTARVPIPTTHLPAVWPGCRDSAWASASFTTHFVIHNTSWLQSCWEGMGVCMQMFINTMLILLILLVFIFVAILNESWSLPSSQLTQADMRPNSEDQEFPLFPRRGQ